MDTSSWQGTMPNTATQVAELQNSAFSLNKKGIMSNDFLQDTVYRMMALRDQIKQEETRFFNTFGIQESKEGLLMLQQRFNELNADPGFRAMSNLSDSYFDELVSAAMNKIDLTKPVDAIFQDGSAMNQFFDSDFIKDQSEIPIGAFIDALNKTRKETGGMEITTGSRINKSSSGARGLSKYLGRIVIKPGGKQDRIQIEFEKSLPHSWQARLRDDYNLLLDNAQISRSKIIENWLQTHITNPEIKKYVMYQFRSKISSYDLNSSAASIKGFLGEVRTAAFLDYLCKRNGSSVPIGNVRQIVNGNLGGEIAIDVLLRGCGFQVKNYRLSKDGSATFVHRETMGLGNFVIDRMRPEAGIAKMLSELFGSWAFNQPTDDATTQYHQIYNRFEQYDPSQVFDGYMDNILKISDQFQANMKAFAKEGLYFNTFFVIGDKFVPSSEMLTAIIRSLQTAKGERLISSSYNIIAPNAGGERWSMNNQQTSTSAVDLANRGKISWTITVNLSEILERAYMGLG